MKNVSCSMTILLISCWVRGPLPLVCCLIIRTPLTGKQSIMGISLPKIALTVSKISHSYGFGVSIKILFWLHTSKLPLRCSNLKPFIRVYSEELSGCPLLNRKPLERNEARVAFPQRPFPWPLGLLLLRFWSHSSFIQAFMFIQKSVQDVDSAGKRG